MQIFVLFFFSCLRPSTRAGPPPNARVLGAQPPPPRSLPTIAPDAGDDTLIQAIMNLDRGFVFMRLPHVILLGNRHEKENFAYLCSSLSQGGAGQFEKKGAVPSST